MSESPLHTRIVSPLLLAAALTVVPGCGAGDDVGCDFRQGSVNGPEERCQERTGLQATAFAGACETLGGTVLEGGCPRDGVTAECALEEGTAAGGRVVDLYYEISNFDAELDCPGEFTVIEERG